MVEGEYTFYDLMFRTPRYRNANLVFLSRITLFGQLGWALYHEDSVDERVLFYGLPSTHSSPPCNVQFRCLAGSDAPILQCLIGPASTEKDKEGKKKKTKKAKKSKKRKKKTTKRSEKDNGNSDIKNALSNKSSNNSVSANSNSKVIKLTGLNQILNSKREDKIREEILLLELEHKIIHYFKHMNVNTTNVEKVALEYLWNENELFDMMKKKFNVDIFTLDMPPFLSDEEARAKAIENIERKRRLKRKGSKEIKLKTVVA